MGRVRADVRIVLAVGLSRPRRLGSTYCLMQDLGDLVHADHRTVGVQGLLASIKDRCTGTDKITVGLCLQVPAAHFSRLQPVFLSATRTVSRPMESNSTRLFALVPMLIRPAGHAPLSVGAAPASRLSSHPHGPSPGPRIPMQRDLRPAATENRLPAGRTNLRRGVRSASVNTA